MKTLRIAAVAAKLGMAEGTIRNWLVVHKFPKPFKLNGVNIWDEEDIDRWLLTLKQESTNGSSSKTQGVRTPE